MENWTNFDKRNIFIGFLMRQKVSDRVVYWYHLLNVAGIATSKSVAGVVNIARARSVASKRSKDSKYSKWTVARAASVASVEIVARVTSVLIHEVRRYR